MKKTIYNMTKVSTGKIWRNNIEPTGSLTMSQQMEKDFNDPSIYITGSKTDISKFVFPTTILEEYPEYLDGWATIITNTGLICFYKIDTNGDIIVEDNNFVIYDMFDDESTSDPDSPSDGFLDDIKPDISMLLQYNMFDQPLSVRRVNFTDNKFTPERSYRYNGATGYTHWCVFLNVDSIGDDNYNESYQVYRNSNSFFEVVTENLEAQNIDIVRFNYKPLFVFRIYNTNGTKKDNATIKVDGIAAERYSEGVYFIDLSARESKDLVSISLQDCGSGYLEVI